jgi:cell division protease FtsH
MDKETLSREEVLRIFAPIEKRPTRGSYTGYGKRLPSDRPPVLTPKELALTAAEVNDHPAVGNGQTGAIGGGAGQGSGQPSGGQGQAPPGSGEGR